MKYEYIHESLEQLEIEKDVVNLQNSRITREMDIKGLQYLNFHKISSLNYICCNAEESSYCFPSSEMQISKLEHLFLFQLNQSNIFRWPK